MKLLHLNTHKCTCNGAPRKCSNAGGPKAQTHPTRKTWPSSFSTHCEPDSRIPPLRLESNTFDGALVHVHTKPNRRRAYSCNYIINTDLQKMMFTQPTETRIWQIWNAGKQIWQIWNAGKQIWNSWKADL
ncbi:hypothetical protein DEO72_LG2g3569 [Vigna unguiculata]|uniref:Uncharacterized protein n=1 Tax=Vigna unguiculata TaxID=3917 RepID=A0A4D6L412_VIGUN|nr:hypothetical protein DEO72_LG2g3569 [Vigna unguiculata]